MTKPIFYFEKSDTFDKWSIGLYSGFTLLLFYVFEIEKDFIFGYALLTQLFLYIVCYRSLRNLTVYFLWIGIGLFHFYLYQIFKDDPTLQMLRGHAAMPLRNTIPLLLIFQILRFLSLKIQGQELVSPSKGSATDLFDERKVNWLDIVFFFTYLGCLIGLTFNAFAR
jgi:hypothetical protein